MIIRDNTGIILNIIGGIVGAVRTGFVLTR